MKGEFEGSTISGIVGVKQGFLGVGCRIPLFTNFYTICQRLAVIKMKNMCAPHDKGSEASQGLGMKPLESRPTTS